MYTSCVPVATDENFGSPKIATLPVPWVVVGSDMVTFVLLLRLEPTEKPVPEEALVIVMTVPPILDEINALASSRVLNSVATCAGVLTSLVSYLNSFPFINTLKVSVDTPPVLVPPRVILVICWVGVTVDKLIPDGRPTDVTAVAPPYISYIIGANSESSQTVWTSEPLEDDFTSFSRGLTVIVPVSETSPQPFEFAKVDIS